MPHPLVRQNPAWTNSALLRQWDDIERLVGRARMPKVNSHTANKLVAQEYGSGVYGTVMPTNTKGIVVKVTSDPTEATFAYMLSKMGRYPEGIVKYYDVFELEGERRGRPIYVLWREEAYDVGKSLTRQAANMLVDLRSEIDPAFRLTYSEPERSEHLRPIKSAARAYRKHTGYERGGSGPNLVGKAKMWLSDKDVRAGYGIDAARAIADNLAHGDSGRLVGAAIRDLIDRDILLADIHPGNVGKVPRRGQMRTVITDPGNVGFLTNKHHKYEVPTIEEAIRRGRRARRVA